MKIKIRLLLASIIRALRGEVSTKRLVEQGLKVGCNFNREGGVRLDTSHCYLIEIGDNVTLAPNVNILAHDSSLKNFLGYIKLGKVVIGNNVFIGANSVVLPGVRIGSNVIIGSGSVVTKDIESDMVYAGNPARPICSLADIIDKNRLAMKEGTPVFDRTFANAHLNSVLRGEIKTQISRFGFFETANKIVE